MTGSYFTCSKDSCKEGRTNYNKLELKLKDKYIDRIRYQFLAHEHGFGNNSSEANHIRVSFHEVDDSSKLNDDKTRSNLFWDTLKNKQEFHIDSLARLSGNNTESETNAQDRLYQGEFILQKSIEDTAQLQIGLSTYLQGHQTYKCNHLHRF